MNFYLWYYISKVVSQLYVRNSRNCFQVFQLVMYAVAILSLLCIGYLYNKQYLRMLERDAEIMAKRLEARETNLRSLDVSLHSGVPPLSDLAASK